jgi:hypothetical protein
VKSGTKSKTRRIHSLGFFWRGENYLIKMKQDLGFLRTSVFANVFNFSKALDPLLIQPSIDAHDGKQVVELESMYAKRVKK